MTHVHVIFIEALLILHFVICAYSVGAFVKTDGSTFQKGFEEYENASFTNNCLCSM